nr:hypothetical protein CFP56_69109 [Quercus suber]
MFGDSLLHLYMPKAPHRAVIAMNNRSYSETDHGLRRWAKSSRQQTLRDLVISSERRRSRDDVRSSLRPCSRATTKPSPPVLVGLTRLTSECSSRLAKEPGSTLPSINPQLWLD